MRKHGALPQNENVIAVKQKATNAYLYVVCLVSVVLMVVMVYVLYEEVFSPGGPQTVFTKAMSLISSNPECQRLLGDPIVGYVEGARRTRRIAHHNYEKVIIYKLGHRSSHGNVLYSHPLYSNFCSRTKRNKYHCSIDKTGMLFFSKQNRV